MKNSNILMMAMFMVIGASTFTFTSEKFPNVNNDAHDIKIILPVSGSLYFLYHDTCGMGEGKSCIKWKNTPAKITPDDANNYYLPSLRQQFDKYFLALSDGKEIQGTSHTGNEFVNKTQWAFSPNGKTNTIS
jgi:uncharacterized protein YxeA